jgi:hypothetical protein
MPAVSNFEVVETAIRECTASIAVAASTCLYAIRSASACMDVYML